MTIKHPVDYKVLSHLNSEHFALNTGESQGKIAVADVLAVQLKN